MKPIEKKRFFFTCLHLLCINKTIVELQLSTLLQSATVPIEESFKQLTLLPSCISQVDSKVAYSPSLPPKPYEQITLPEQLALPPLQTPQKRFTFPQSAYFPFLLRIPHKQPTPPHQLTFISLRPTPHNPQAAYLP